jgi:hypothetical protein
MNKRKHSSGRVVFLLDVDNTLLDNDGVQADLRRHLIGNVGRNRAKEYWRMFELLRWGLAVILSDGDVVFQPLKITRSGLAEAVSDPKILASYPAANISIARIGDLLKYKTPPFVEPKR